VYAVYVTFFPQLIAGPILRASEVIGQLKIRPAFSTQDLYAGIQRIVVGIFLKVVLADNIAGLVDDGYSQSIATLSALDVWTLAFLFGLQIYFDFSAYSHIAIGSARLMGIQFPENFNYPYSANSPREFWRRWHISLSSWIRDYLYLPLVGARVMNRSTGGLAGAASVDNRRKNLALFGTWAIMGLWHGANWTFVVWGLWHAFLVFGYRLCLPMTEQINGTLRSIGGWIVTLPLIMLGWIPFRATSLSDAFMMTGKVLNPYEYAKLGFRENTYLITGLLFIAVIVAGSINKQVVPKLRSVAVWPAIEVTSMSIAIALDFVFLRPTNQFIYFQF
jgi:D-alanyl-lipoteichoic acid acyltransferase DltB (MBOAT superfamily)